MYAASAFLLTAGSPDYKGSGALSLIDHKKGIAGDFRTGLWLGYSEEAMMVIIDLGLEPKEIKEVAVCYAVNTRSYIMPPVKVSIYGGNQPDDLIFLGKVTPAGLNDHQPNEEKTAIITIVNGKYRYYKIEAEPLKKLPKWHEGAGAEGWVFVDEVFFY